MHNNNINNNFIFEKVARKFDMYKYTTKAVVMYRGKLW